MTREILFHGKRVDNGNWVFGYLIVNKDGSCWIKDTDYNVNNGKCDLVPTQVDPSTVGQYVDFHIGVNPVYEDDIVESVSGIGRVIYFAQYCQFMIEHKDGTLENLERAHTHHGNIHDNPELLYP